MMQNERVALALIALITGMMGFIESMTAVTGLGRGRSVRKNESPVEMGGGPSDVSVPTRAAIGLRPG